MLKRGLSFLIAALVIGDFARPAVTQTFTRGCYVVTGGTQCRDDSARWADHVNVREYGTITFNNSYNSTQATANSATIQAAINYAVANNKQVVNLPCGTATSGKIWLNQTIFADVPANWQAVIGTASDSGLIEINVASTAGWSTGNTVQVFSVGGTTEANRSWTITVVDGTHIKLQGSSYANAYTSGGFVYDPVSTGFSVWLHGCGGLNTNLNNGTNLYFVSGLSAPYILFGPGRGLGGDSFTITGNQTGACWAAYPSQSALIAYAAGGSSFELDRVSGSTAYSLLSVGYGGNTLADHVTLNDVNLNNGHYGFYTAGGEPFILNAASSSIGSADYDVYAYGYQINVRGGSYASGGTHANAFGISSTGNLSAVGGNYQISTRVSSPDSQIAANCYNAFVIKTTDFGPVPFTLVRYNAGTITLQMLSPWYVNNFGALNIASVTNLQAELQNATELYAVQKYTVFCGQVNVDGVHVEGDVPLTLVDTNACAAARPVYLKEIDLNIDPSNTGNARCLGQENACEARFLVAQTHPFISIGNTTFTLDGMNAMEAGPPTDPFIIDANTQAYTRCSFKNLAAPLNMVLRWYAYSYNDSYEQYQSNRYKGACDFDRDYWSMQNTSLNRNNNLARAYQLGGDNDGPFKGFRPAPWTVPELTPSQYSQVSGSLPSMGTYPLINGGTIYSVQKNGDTSTRYLVTSAHQWYSWGQNLTINWTYLGGSNWVGLSDTSLMFPGLAITLNLSGIGNTQFVVTGVYPHLGGVTVSYPGTIGTGNQAVTGAPGTITTQYSGSTIGQQSYSWTKATLQ